MSAFHEWIATDFHVQVHATVFNSVHARISNFVSRFLRVDDSLALCDFLWKVHIQDDCLEVGIQQDVYITLQTWPRFCDVAYSRAYRVPGMGWGVMLH